MRLSFQILASTGIEIFTHEELYLFRIFYENTLPTVEGDVTSCAKISTPVSVHREEKVVNFRKTYSHFRRQQYFFVNLKKQKNSNM